MKRTIFSGTLLFFIFCKAIAQSPMPCTQITSSNYSSYGNYISSGSCLQVGNDLPNYVTIAGNNYKEMKAGQNITFYPNTHIKPTGSGVFHAYIQKSNVDVVWIEPVATVAIVGRYEKLELGLKLPELITTRINDFCKLNDETGINPYDYNQISIKATFTSPTGIIRPIDGFFYRDFTEEGPHSTVPEEWHGWWQENSTDYPWRIRFAPDEIGQWAVSIQANCPNYNLNTTLNYTFECSESDNPGFLQIGQNNNQLKFSGSGNSFFAVGANLTWLKYSSTCDISEIPFGPMEVSTLIDWMNDVAANGGNYVRILMTPAELGIEWERLGVYDQYTEYNGLTHNRQERAWELDRIFNHAKELGLYVHLVVDFSMKNAEGGIPPYYLWGNHPYNKIKNNNQTNCTNPKDYLTDVAAKEFVKRRNQYIVSRWGYATNLATIEIINEVDCIGAIYTNPATETYLGDDNASFRSDIYNWSSEISTHIKSLDPYLLTTMSYANTQINDFSFLNVDILASHGYNFRPFNDGVLDKYNYLNNTIYSYTNKPRIFGEMGPDFRITKCDNGVTLHNDLWGTAMMDCYGAGLNWWWDGAIHPNGTYTEFNRLSQFMSTINFEDKNYVHKEYHNVNIPPPLSTDNENHINSDYDAYYMISDDGDEGFGWYHNRSMVWKNFLNINANCYGDLLVSCSIYAPYSAPTALNEEEIWINGVDWCHDYDIYWYYTTGPNTDYFRHDVKCSNCLPGTHILKIKTPGTNIDYKDFTFKFKKNTDKSKNIDTTGNPNTNQDTIIYNNNLIKIFPNPSTTGIFTIVYDVNSNSKYDIFVYDAIGRLILNNENESRQK